MAGALPLWVGSGGSSRALLLSAESFRSAREAPAAGRGCSRCRGDAPSLSPSPGVGGPASAGSKASSSAERERGVSSAVDLAWGREYKDRMRRHSPCLNAATTARGLPCSPLALSTVAGCGARCRLTAMSKPWYVAGETETLSHSVGIKAGVTGLQVGGWKCSQLPAEELYLEHGDEHEYRRRGQSSWPCSKLRSDRGSAQPTHFAGPLHITTGSISPLAQGSGPIRAPLLAKCPRPEQSCCPALGSLAPLKLGSWRL